MTARVQPCRSGTFPRAGGNVRIHTRVDTRVGAPVDPAEPSSRGVGLVGAGLVGQGFVGARLVADVLGQVVDEVGADGEVFAPGRVVAKGGGDDGQPGQRPKAGAAQAGVVQAPVQHRRHVPRIGQPS